MKNIFLLSSVIFLLATIGCADQERVLNDRYVNLSEPQYFSDSIRINKILKIHKKLYKKQPDNLIYFTNVFGANCLLGNFESNRKLIEESILTNGPGINSNVDRNFYLALNQYREDPKSDYQTYLGKLLEEDLSYNPLLGYISAKCLGKEKLADEFYPLMQEYIFEMPERTIINRMIELDECDRFLDLYRGICPVCEICLNRNFI